MILPTDYIGAFGCAARNGHIDILKYLLSLENSIISDIKRRSLLVSQVLL